MKQLLPLQSAPVPTTVLKPVFAIGAIGGELCVLVNAQPQTSVGPHRR